MPVKGCKFLAFVRRLGRELLCATPMTRDLCFHGHHLDTLYNKQGLVPSESRLVEQTDLTTFSGTFTSIWAAMRNLLRKEKEFQFEYVLIYKLHCQ